MNKSKDGKSKSSLRKKGQKECNSILKSQNGDEIAQNSDTEVEVEGPITATNLKLGTKVTAKVCQIQTRELVLDLGGELGGMHKFKFEFSTDISCFYGDKKWREGL